MATPRPWTREEDAQLKKLHSLGRSLHSITKEMGRSGETISRHAKQLGLIFNKAKMLPALEHNAADIKQLRESNIRTMHELAKSIMDEITDVRAGQRRFRTTIKGMGGADVTEIELQYIPPQDMRNLLTSVAATISSVTALEKANNDGGLSEAKSIVGGIRRIVIETNPGIQDDPQ
jgi:hypothetical protein